MQFRWVKAPTRDKLTQLTHTIAQRVTRFLRGNLGTQYLIICRLRSRFFSLRSRPTIFEAFSIKDSLPSGLPVHSWTSNSFNG